MTASKKDPESKKSSGVRHDNGNRRESAKSARSAKSKNESHISEDLVEEEIKSANLTESKENSVTYEVQSEP